MKGQMVVCKDFTGSALVRKVWEDSEHLIFVHTGDQYESRTNRLPHLEVVGFPSEDVFMYDREALNSSDPWKLLIPYRSDAEAASK